MVANLTIEDHALADQIAAVADQQLQRGPSLVARGFQERATGDGSPMDGREVLVVGLVARINRLAVLLGGEGMKDAGLETRCRKGALHEAVIAARAFDGDDTIAKLVLLERLADLGDGGLERRSGMIDHRRRDQQTAIEVAEQKLGACFAAVKADDAEVLGPNLLDARMQDAARFTDRSGNAPTRRT